MAFMFGSLAKREITNWKFPEKTDTKFNTPPKNNSRFWDNLLKNVLAILFW